MGVLYNESTTAKGDFQMNTKQFYQKNAQDATAAFSDVEEMLERCDTVRATVIQTTRRGVVLSFNGGCEGFAFGTWNKGTVVWASIQKIQEGFTRLSIDSVIAYPAA